MLSKKESWELSFYSSTYTSSLASGGVSKFYVNLVLSISPSNQLNEIPAKTTLESKGQSCSLVFENTIPIAIAAVALRADEKLELTIFTFPRLRVPTELLTITLTEHSN